MSFLLRFKPGISPFFGCPRKSLWLSNWEFHMIPFFENRAGALYCGDVIETLQDLSEKSVHMAVTSPPYWRLRDYGLPPSAWGGDPEHNHHFEQPGLCRCGAWKGCLGLEPTLEMFIEHIVQVFRAVRRVLRDDGTCWINMGDTYAASKNVGNHISARVPDGLKAGDLCGMPWKVAFALQKDGWWLRSCITWSKPNPMPESINGWRWEQHRIKARHRPATRKKPSGWDTKDLPHQELKGRYDGDQFEAEMIPCPGCPKCAPNDGLVLRKGSWRPTTAHEYIFLLSKSDKYFCDAEAVREPQAGNSHSRGKGNTPKDTAPDLGIKSNSSFNLAISSFVDVPGGRNSRSVWTIPPEPCPEAHFACFPRELPRRAILAGTSKKGCCPSCGATWVRVLEPTEAYAKLLGRDWADYEADLDEGRGHFDTGNGKATQHPTKRDAPSVTAAYRTLGWKPSCQCKDAGEPVPCAVLDPFMGSGTTAIAAQGLDRKWVGIELSPDYCKIAQKRILSEAAQMSLAI